MCSHTCLPCSVQCTLSTLIDNDHIATNSNHPLLAPLPPSEDSAPCDPDSEVDTNGVVFDVSALRFDSSSSSDSSGSSQHKHSSVFPVCVAWWCLGEGTMYGPKKMS